jgi:hypothetical protein
MAMFRSAMFWLGCFELFCLAAMVVVFVSAQHHGRHR